MTKREAEFLERLILDEYQTVLSWMSGGCKGSLWEWYRPPRNRKPAESDRGGPCGRTARLAAQVTGSGATATKALA
jgi:hypothetical protein